MPIAFTFLLGGFMARNPTAVGQESQIATVGQGTGLVRITRHPFQWAVVLWSVAHIIANGDVASLLFFGSLGTLSLAGTFLIDMKKARTMGARVDCICRRYLECAVSERSSRRGIVWCWVNWRCRWSRASSLLRW